MARSVAAARLRSGAFVERLRARLYLSRFYRWRFAGSVADRLLLAPQDIRTTDPVAASDIRAGRFSFAGHLLNCEGSPFSETAPAGEWQRELLGFGWLRHLRALPAEEAATTARGLIGQWIAQHGDWRPVVSWETEVTARRIIAWISHSPLILDGADHVFYRSLMRSLSRQTRYLERSQHGGADGIPRLRAVIALNFAGLCINRQGKLQKRAAAMLVREIGRQILADGGHISRNPVANVSLLLDLLPLRQTFAARDIPPPEALLNAIDRMMPMVRFFRHGDGALAQFNGCGVTPIDRVATVLAYDDTFGKPASQAPNSGYQRMEMGPTIVMLDSGKAPPGRLSSHAHAGCLSFELSTGKQRIIVNCGHPTETHAQWIRAARTSAAHSTISLDDRSSSRFLDGSPDSPIISGPQNVDLTRQDDADAILVTASHDGYYPELGIIHQRELSLEDQGATLRGADRLKMGRPADKINYVVRFHLHPDIRANEVQNVRAILLTLPNHEIWAFSADHVVPVLEDSVFLSAADGPVRTQQICLYGNSVDHRKLRWQLQQMQAPTV